MPLNPHRRPAKQICDPMKSVLGGLTLYGTHDYDLIYKLSIPNI